jgi:4-hydroxy-tetrahydrodipicolinate synthase
MSEASADPATRSDFDSDDVAGVIPILVTPFNQEGVVSFDDLDRELEFLIEVGILRAGFGFGSEVDRLADAELSSAVGHAVAATSGRLMIIGNAEMRSITSGIEQVRRMEAAGAPLALVRPAGLQGASQEGLLEAFATVAESGGIPIIVQDAPGSTGVDLAPATLARLLMHVPAVAAVKVEPADPARKIRLIMDRLDGHPGTVIGGGGGLQYLRELQRGARGTMPGPAYPELFAAAGRLHSKGERQAAQKLMARAMPLLSLGAQDGDAFIFVQKHVLRRRGVLSAVGRSRPHWDVDPELAQDIDELLDTLALLELFDECRAIGW